MSGFDWGSFIETIDVRSAPVPVPSDDILDQYERLSGFRLPSSYRGFLRTIGPGQCAYDFRIYSPGYGGLPKTFRLAAFNTFMRKRLTAEVIQDFSDPGRVARLIFFAENSGGDLAGWDPEDIRDSAGHEYGIYLLLKGFDDTPLAAVSFSEFVQDVCFGRRFLELVGDTSDYIPERVFEAARD